MSFTLFTLITAAAPTVLNALGNYVKENKGTVIGLLKQSKPVINEATKKLDNELCKYEDDGWSKDKEG